MVRLEMWVWLGSKVQMDIRGQLVLLEQLVRVEPREPLEYLGHTVHMALQEFKAAGD